MTRVERVEAMFFTDIHSHLLYGLDDGVQSEDEMYQAVDAAYSGGTRGLCLTPHYHPGFYRYDESTLHNAFHKLKQYANTKYPDLELYLGNELYYSQGRLAQVGKGECRTLNHSRYLLVDFSSDESADKIEEALRRILACGYAPVLAHVERYSAFYGKTDRLRRLRDNGIVMQMDAGAVLGQYGLAPRLFGGRLLRHGLIDLIASDAHGREKIPSSLQRCYEYVCSHMDAAYAAAAFDKTPRRILNGEDIRKD